MNRRMRALLAPWVLLVLSSGCKYQADGAAVTTPVSPPGNASLAQTPAGVVSASASQTLSRGVSTVANGAVSTNGQYTLTQVQTQP
jgi:hypothetical protein